MGGSYPGALAAWFQASFPGKADVAWSSSGVIVPIRDFVNFDLDIYQATLRSGPECPAAIQAMTAFLDAALDKGGADLAYVKQVFGFDKIDFGDFMFYIADIFTESVQYGGREDLCNVLASLQGTDMKQQLPVLRQYGSQKGVNIADYDRANLKATTIDVNKSGRQWTWQYCTEFGWFQVPNPDHPMRSQKIASKYWLPFCQSLFGADLKEPNIQYYLDKYGGLNLKAKNLVLVNNIEDPWQYAGMRQLTSPTGD